MAGLGFLFRAIVTVQIRRNEIVNKKTIICMNIESEQILRSILQSNKNTFALR
jgi:hypothetical protein